MPLTGSLSSSARQLVRDWVSEGALENEATPPADPDRDGDGVPDANDPCPDDANEIDTDGDEICNNADTDDDNDGISDSAEISVGLDPLDANDVTGSPRVRRCNY